MLKLFGTYSKMIVTQILSAARDSLLNADEISLDLNSASQYCIANKYLIVYYHCVSCLMLIRKTSPTSQFLINPVYTQSTALWTGLTRLRINIISFDYYFYVVFP